MRRALLLLQVPVLIAVMLTVCLAQANKPIATSEARKDPRLDQKVTYQVKLRTIADVADDLTKLTGVKFYAGHNDSDWRVREDCMTIWAKDIPLSSLMASIGHVMKYSWSRHGQTPEWTYRIVEDEKAIAKVKRQVAEKEQRDAAERQDRWDRVIAVSKMSSEELEKIKDDDPRLYLYAKSGALAPFVDFLQHAPDVSQAYFSGQSMQMSISWLQPSARESLLKAARADVLMESRIMNDEDYTNHVNSRLSQLDSSSTDLTLNILSFGSSPYLQLSGKGVSSGFSFDRPDKESQKLRQRVILKAYEQGIPISTIYAQTGEQLHAVIMRERPRVAVWSDTQEPLIEHSPDAVPGKLTQIVNSKVVPEMMSALADASGFAVVTDDLDGPSELAFEKDTQVQKAVDDVSIRFRRNWNRCGQAIELWDLNWYDSRDARVSKVWLAALRRKFKENGTLDIDDLCDIASLTNTQFFKNIRDDSVLAPAGRTVEFRREYLRIYGALTPLQRSQILSEQGLSFASLTADQQASLLKLVSTQSVPFLQTLDLAGIGAGVKCTKEANGKQLVYTLRGYTALGEIPDQVHFRTPLYVAPPQEDHKQ